jgi:hypothetical protein
MSREARRQTVKNSKIVEALLKLEDNLKTVQRRGAFLLAQHIKQQPATKEVPNK